MLAIVLGAEVSRAAAEPGAPLGESTKGPGRPWWNDSSPLSVTPELVADRRGHVFVDDWQAAVDGVPIDHDRFYELADRPDLARRRLVRRGVGALAIVGGIAAGSFGAAKVVGGHVYGLALLGGGYATALAGAYVELTPDPISASDAQQLADSYRGMSIGYGGRF